MKVKEKGPHGVNWQMQILSKYPPNLGSLCQFNGGLSAGATGGGFGKLPFPCPEGNETSLVDETELFDVPAAITL